MQNTTPTSSPTIFILDDDPVYTATVGQFLEMSGYTVSTFGDYKSFLQAIDLRIPDMVLIDLELQSDLHDGLDVIQSLRSSYSDSLAILVVTNHDEDEYYLQANRSMVDGFLEKRRDFKVLKSFIDSILYKHQPHRFTSSDTPPEEWLLDSFHWIVAYRQGEKSIECKLSEKEYLILEWMSRTHGGVISRQKIMNLCNQTTSKPIRSMRSVDNIIRHLRDKIIILDPVNGHKAIESVYGSGYRLLIRVKVH